MPSNLKFFRPLLLVLSFFLLLGLYTKLIGPVELRVNQTSTQKAATFDVTGEGSATVIPDQAEITLGITTTAATVTAAQQQANQVINSITKSLKDSGVGESDIKTLNYSVNPNYDYREGTNRITGYTVSANLLAKFTDFEKLNQAIDQATSLGANQVGEVTFTLSDKAQAQAEDEARKQAVQQAKTKADSLSRAAGIKLGKIINVQENSSPPPGPIFRTMEAASPDSAPQPPTQIEPGSTEVNLTVTLSYETL